MLSSVIALLLASSTGVLAQTSNLPDVAPGVFNVSTRIEIQTTTSAVWNALTNFPAYAEWNPFVRLVKIGMNAFYSVGMPNKDCSAAVVVSPLNITLPEQYPVEGKRLFLRTQIPPLPLPVDASTPDNILHTQFAYENITHVQPELLRLAWEYAVS
jgi:hypothetical protein